MDIRSLLKTRILISDGAMGTMLQQHGLKTGELPEMLNFTHPEIIEKIHAAYFDAGSDFVCTNTFGANRLKTESSGYTVAEIVTQAVTLAKKAAAAAAKRAAAGDQKDHDSKFVALDLGPIGKLMKPAGTLTFEEACDLYREQILPGVAAGADLILIETITDLYEMKAAAVTAREVTDLPIFCSVTFQEDGRMLMGADPLTVVNTLQDLGIDALGVNCSLGPKEMVPIIKEILEYARIPVLVQPNAGLPEMIDGETRYDVTVAEYTEAMEEMLRAGATVVGGCCGTNPEYIRSLANSVKQINDAYEIAEEVGVARRIRPPFTAVSSSTKTVILDHRIRIIGERINPTGKKLLKEALKAQDYSYIENEATSQVKAGAEVLDINVGLPEIDEKATMLEAVRRVSAVVDAPLQIDSADPKVLEAAVRLYNGKPIINSVNGKQESMDAVFPIVKKYGACVIALTLDETGLPKDVADRLTISEKIIREAEKYGIGRERILVDCLTLTVSAQQNAGRDTLEAIRQVKERFGVKTTLGASNVSFGLPERKLLNRTFLAMALEAGLDAPITDPLAEEYVDTIRAFEALSGKDKDSGDYIAAYGVKKETGAGGTTGGQKPSNEGGAVGPTPSEVLIDIILNGYEDRAAQATEELLKTKKPLEIVEEVIIPTLEIVGKEYETGEKFLPQLIKSADTVKAAFVILKAAMETGGGTISYGTVLLATVKGDIHDIGKNIAKVLFENYGYEVIDLGKDTEIQAIVDAVREHNIKLVGLSALMTTTVVYMEATIKALKEAGLDCKVAVGGAVLNPEYAARIKADFYCKDAMEGVRVANALFKEESLS